MACLRDNHSQRVFPVEAELVIGRSANAGLRIDKAYVSTQHALLRWVGKTWEIKDLGSRNGTLLNGTPLVAGHTYRAARGAVLAFGHAEECWELFDDDPPHAMAIPLDGTDPLVATNEILGLPSSESPLASIYRDLDGIWRLEDENGEVTVLEQHARFEVGGRVFRFCFPEVVNATTTAGRFAAAADIVLEFAVSRDEEHVELRAIAVGRTIELGSRSHNYLLLTLARYRLRDAEGGESETTSGWVYQDELLKALATTQSQLNIDVFRIRQHFARAELLDSINVIERRPRTQQLRIGTGKLRIRSL